MTGWRSLHLFVADREDLDGLILEAASVIGRFPDCRDDWFFIRYVEGGLHLRLRIGAQASRHFDDIRAHMADICAKTGAGRAPEPWIIKTQYPDANGQIFDVGAAIDIAYEPEVMRYAGDDAMVINERLFRVSSRIALAVIRAAAKDPHRRVPLAMELMLAAIAGLCGGDISPGDYLRTYAAFWSEAWRDSGMTVALQGGGSIDFAASYARYLAVAAGRREVTTPIDEWSRTLAAARVEFAALHRQGRLTSPMTGTATVGADAFAAAMLSLTHSQMHMLNNRMGLWPYYEIAMADRLIAQLR
jgi:Lantibiotic biosynthesis dehydratase C-term